MLAIADAIIVYLQENPGWATLRDLADAVGVKPGFGKDPMASLLNQALVYIRASGMIEVHNPEWGGNPSFRLLSSKGE
jgi:hypothetical protein